MTLDTAKSQNARSPAEPRLGPRVLVLAALAVTAIAVALALPPIAQDPAYHRFADARPLGGIPNGFNVASNVAFLLVGALGLVFVARAGAPRPDGPITERWERWSVGVLFAGVALTGVGSTYYHLAPDNGRLVWDRLPMTLAFMSLLALTLGERIDGRAGRVALPLLLAAGAASVLVWHLGEASGAGDLRAYGLVQFFPMAAVPLMLALFPARYTRGGDLVVALVFYAVAKAAELADAAIFALGRVVSGHTLKHLVAALATWQILRMLERRHRLG